MSLTAVSLPAADVSAVQFNAGKKAHCGQTLALFLDNDGSPIEKKRRERVEVWENCAHVWFSKREEVSGERPIEFGVCVCVCVYVYMPVIAKMESETGRERRLGWDMKISSGKKKWKKNEWAEHAHTVHPPVKQGDDLHVHTSRNANYTTYSASKLTSEIKRGSQELHEMYAKCSYFSISSFCFLCHRRRRRCFNTCWILTVVDWSH